MENTQYVSKTSAWQPQVSLQRALLFLLITGLVLLVVSVIGFGVALRSGTVPPFDIHLTLDGRHALVIHNDLPCVPDEPPQQTCGGGQWLREFRVMFSTPHADQVLLVFGLPED